MERIVIEVKEKGTNGYLELRSQLWGFVSDNFDLLYEGACRLKHNIADDDYAPRRVQINNTRLHESESIGLKYADGHKYCDDQHPTEAQLRQTVLDIQALLDAATQDIPAPFDLRIVEVG